MWLVIAEKDKTARRIAGILFKDLRTFKRYGVSYYFSPSNDAVVLGLKGHVVEVDYPKEYNDWRSTPLESLLDARFVWRVKEKGIVKLLMELARDVSRVTVATDYDREGELIGVEAVKIIKRVNPSVRVDRVRFSALTPVEVRRAFSNPVNVDYNLAKAAEVRQKIDLMWGAVLTRLLSLSAGKLGKDFLSVGRVQSPTLRLIVEREKQIMEFKSKKYWEVHIRVKGVDMKLEKKFESKEEAQNVLKSVDDFVEVLRFEKKRVVERRPIPFNTTEFLKEASKFMDPDRAMRIAEDLYMSGYISYPRTDNTVYPPSLNLRDLVEMFLSSEFDKEARIVLSGDMIPSKGKKETSDHPPIHPTDVATRDELGRDEWLIYELVVRRFLATLSSDALWETGRVVVGCGDLRFTASGKRIVEMGWRLIYPYIGFEEKSLPEFKVGEVLRVEWKGVLEKRTKPPQRYTTGRLIKLMERLGLGTKSTRHEIIKKLFDRRYIYGNPVRPTRTAFAVIEALKKNAELITLPDMTAKLEGYMDAIAEGRMREEDVIEESRRFLREILDSVDLKELGKCLREGIEEDERKRALGPCPECDGYLVIKRGEKRFIGCVNYPKCKFSIPLPQRGRIYILSKRCERHGIRHIRIRDGKSVWDLGCPYCSWIEREKNSERLNTQKRRK